MKKFLLPFALAATLSAPALAAEQYLVRVPANVNLSAIAPETPQEPIFHETCCAHGVFEL